MSTKIIAERGKQNIIIKRKFDAQKALVFKMFEQPDLYVEWACPPDGNIRMEQYDFHDGGQYIYHHQHYDGSAFTFYGVFHEIVRPDYMIRTSEFRGLPHKLVPVLESYHFKEDPNHQTELSITIICPTEEYRDGMLQSGMQAQFEHIFERLDLLIVEKS